MRNIAIRWELTLAGRVISVTDYGAFVELEQGIEGLVHVSEMTWSKRMKHPVEAGECRRPGGVRSHQRESRRAADFARNAATGLESLGFLARQVSRGRHRRRPRAQPDRLRRLHRNRRRHRRPGARQQFELDQAGEASFGSAEEGRPGKGRRAGHRARQAAPVAGRQTASARCLGDLLQRSITSETCCTARFCA